MKKKQNHLIAPSMLSCNFSMLRNEVEMINNSYADWFHLDIMDGVFVPNLSFGFPVIQHIKKYAKKPLDVHLMIVNPEHYIKRFNEVGANILTVHYETCTHLNRTINEIKSLGMKAGVSINPHTPVHVLNDIISEVDLVLIMSVNPGYGGQQFIANSFQKIMELTALIKQKKVSPYIEVDGGVDFNNASQLVKTGANVLVAGNTIFSSKNPSETIRLLKMI